MRKYQRLGGLNNGNVFSHSSRGRMSKVKFPLRPLSPALADSYLLIVSSCGVFCLLVSSISKFPLLIQIGLGPTLVALL